MAMLAVSARDETALRVLCYDIPKCTPLKDTFYLPLLNVVLMAKGILKLKDPASEEDPGMFELDIYSTCTYMHVY